MFDYYLGKPAEKKVRQGGKQEKTGTEPSAKTGVATKSDAKPARKSSSKTGFVSKRPAQEEYNDFARFLGRLLRVKEWKVTGTEWAKASSWMWHPVRTKVPCIND